MQCKQRSKADGEEEKGRKEVLMWAARVAEILRADPSLTLLVK